MARARSAAQIATIRRPDIGLCWKVVDSFQAYLQLIGSWCLTRSNLWLPSILGLLLRLLITRSHLMHLDLLLVRTNMIRFRLQFDKVVRYRSFVRFHVCALRWIHYLVVYEHATRFKRGLILIRIVRVSIRSIHGRCLILIQVYALGRC